MPGLMRLAALLLAALLSPLAAFAGGAQPVRLVVPFAAGGGVDAAARLLAPQLQRRLGVPVLVENHPGGSGSIGARLVLGAPADGHTLLFSATTHVLAQQVFASPPYDPQTDFIPLARIGQAPLLLVVAPGRREPRLQELLAAVRREPGTWTAGIASVGSPGHLATLRLARRAGLKLTLVPYRGTQPALMDVAGGHTDLLLDSVVALLPLARSGQVRALAVSSLQRSPMLPGVPTFDESGLAGFSHQSWYGVWAARGTAPARVAELDAALQAATAALSRSGAFAGLGIEAAPLPSAAFRRFIASEVAAAAELLKASGFVPE
ncbi:hypothetical protein CLD22_14455 [Rubrivivax gelatinosus]|nr:hypothetical protein [Rubrivivax gelatinosus]